MPIKKKVTGSGFTKRRRTVISEPFGDEEIRALKDAVDAQEDDLDMIERSCKTILELAGLPDSLRVVVWREDGSWHEAPDGFDTEPTPGDESIGSLNGRVGDGRQVSEDSPGGYASRMLVRLGRLRSAVERGEADRVAREGLYLGALWREMEMKMRMEESALRGVPFIDGPKGPRRDDLSRAIDDVLNRLGDDRDAQDVWNELLKHADKGFPPYNVINSDDSDPTRLYWHRSGSRGKEESLNFDSFKRRLQNQKKKRAAKK